MGWSAAATFSRGVDEKTILYRFTVEDAETWDQPWTAELAIAKEKGPIYEFACHEGNLHWQTRSVELA